MIFIFYAFAAILIVMAVIAGGVMLRDAGVRRQRRLSADVVDGMPDEIQDLPSQADGSTGPEEF